MRRWDQRMALALRIGFARYGWQLPREEWRAHRNRVSGLFIAALAFALSREKDRPPHERRSCEDTMARMLTKHGPANQRWLNREARRRFAELQAEGA